MKPLVSTCYLAYLVITYLPMKHLHPGRQVPWSPTVKAPEPLPPAQDPRT